MFESAKAPVVPDNEENKALCRKYCPICQNYKKHDLHRNEPKESFLCPWIVQCPEHERDRLLLPGLRAFHQAPSPRRILLRPAINLFFIESHPLPYSIVKDLLHYLDLFLVTVIGPR